MDQALEVVALLLFALLWVFSFVAHAALPDIIPTHFNMEGMVDGYGSKLHILSMAGVGTFIYLLLTIVNRYPHKFNYIRDITPENAANQYRRMTKLMRGIKVLLLTIFFVILNMMTRSARHHHIQTNVLLFIAITAVVAVPVFIAFYAGKADKHTA